MSKIEWLLKNLRGSSRKQGRIRRFMNRNKIPIPTINQLNHMHLNNRKKIRYFIGHLEFILIFSISFYGIYYISKHKDNFSPTTRLVATGVVSHLVVDVATYFADKINTEVKVESFKPVDNTKRGIFSEHFKKEYYHEYKSKRRVQTQLSSFYTSSYKGIQSGVLFLMISSVFFYSFYKNIKHYMKHTLGIEGFFNFFTSAGIAQFFALAFAFPIETIKTRMQASPKFNYYSIFSYYKKNLYEKKGSLLKKTKKEYSGFFSHLILYVVFEAITFGTYESLMEYMTHNHILSSKKKENTHVSEHSTLKEDPSAWQILVASAVSGIIAGVVTNPIDVYQINKQVSHDFSLKQLNKGNIFVGVRERVNYILLMNILTFFSLEKIGPKYFNIRLEDD